MSLKDRLNAQPKLIINKDAIKLASKGEMSPMEQMAVNNEGLGVIEPLFIDEGLNSISVSGAKNIYVEKRGIIHKSTTTYRDNTQLLNIIKRNAKDSGADINSPFLKFNYKEGINITATLPPLSNVPTLFVKCYNDKNGTIKALEESKIISKELSMIFEAISTLKCNILIAGTKQSLKTTVLSAIAKLLPSNNRGVLIDFNNEFKIETPNYTSYDFSIIENEIVKSDILNSIISSAPDKIVLNDCEEDLMYELLKAQISGLKGVMTVIEAVNPYDALTKIAHIILKNNPTMDFETAKIKAYKVFELMIFCNKDEEGRRTLSKISQLNVDENNNCEINDIFYTNEIFEHASTGFVPDFYKASKINSLPISINIFDKNYKHTYHQSSNQTVIQQNSPYNDFLKKIKENSTKITSKDNSIESLNSDELMKKVQEKFEELKRNAKSQEEEKESLQNEEYIENNEFNSNEEQVQ